MHKLTFKHTHSYTHIRTHIHSHSLSLSHSHSLSHLESLAHSLSFNLTFTLTQILTLTLSFSHTLAFTLPHSHPHSHSHPHYHSHTHISHPSLRNTNSISHDNAKPGYMEVKVEYDMASIKDIIGTKVICAKKYTIVNIQKVASMYLDTPSCIDMYMTCYLIFIVM